MEKLEQKTKRKHQRHSWFIRRQVAIEYLDGTKTLRQLSMEYGIPNQTISNWSKTYAGEGSKSKDRTFINMTGEEQKHVQALLKENELLKKQLQSDQALKKENEALKGELEFSQMKAKAMEIVIDLAKEEYGIDLIKNSGARQPARSKKTTRRQK